MPTMLILGATSDIARATALAFASDGWDLRLAGRNQEELRRIATDIQVRSGRTVTCLPFDAATPEKHEALWKSIADDTQGLFCAVGLLGDQEKARHDMKLAADIFTANFTGIVPILAYAADTFEQRRSGLIAVVSSVAGDRGRASNYTYGSAKAALTAYLSGLRQRLASKGVHVITVKPGFVATQMTEGKDLPVRLTATSQQVAEDILKAVKKRKSVLYTRWYWKWIMALIKCIPDVVFNRMKNF